MTSLLKLLRLSHTSPSRCCPSVGNSQTDRSSSCCAADGSNQDILLLSPSPCQHANQIFMSNNKPPHSRIVIVGWKQYVLLTGPLLPNLRSLKSKTQNMFFLQQTASCSSFHLLFPSLLNILKHVYWKSS